MPVDDYHFGESLLGWWSLREFGSIPYVDYFPPHGVFGDDIGGFISLMFYDGTAASIGEADRLAGTLTMFAAFLALRIYTGSLGLAYISTLLFGTISNNLNLLILVPFFCLWLKGSNLKPQVWVMMWLISSLILILLVPPQGLLAVVASSPLVALYLYRARNVDWKRELLILILLVSALVVFTPVPGMLFGSIRYVFENGPINQIAYGLPWAWSLDWAIPERIKIISEFFRMSWIWIPVVALALSIAMLRQRESLPYLIGVALPVLLFASLMTPYTLGRIDPAAMSRPGVMANFAWAVLLPILITPLLGPRGRATLAIGIAFVCAGIGLASPNRDGFHSVLVKNEVVNSWSGAAHGLKNMGSGIVESAHADRLLRINQFLSSRLDPRETYLDLTGRNAHYMYLDRRPAMPTTAPYNLVPITQQQRIVEHLRELQPRIALLEADNLNFDGGGMALRTHLLYRYVVTNYDAELHDGLVYGIEKSTSLQRVGLSFTLSQLTDSNWLDGIHRSENAIVIRDSLSVRYLQVGDTIVLPDNKLRKITRIWSEGNAIWFDGRRVLPGHLNAHSEIKVMLDEDRRKRLSDKLMAYVFTVADLRKVPLAWGKSKASLNSAMKHILDLDFSYAGLHDLIGDEDGFRVTGTDPYLWLDLAKYNVAGKSAGLLKFDFSCEGLPNPKIQIFWWGDDMQGADQAQSLIFTAGTGTMIIPLDAYPGWLGMKQVKGIRIDLGTADACHMLSIRRASLNQRINTLSN